MSVYKPLSVIGDLAGAVEDAHRVEEDVVPEAHAGPVEQLDAGAGRARARQAVAAWALFIPHKISAAVCCRPPRPEKAERKSEKSRFFRIFLVEGVCRTRPPKFHSENSKSVQVRKHQSTNSVEKNRNRVIIRQNTS